MLPYMLTALTLTLLNFLTVLTLLKVLTLTDIADDNRLRKENGRRWKMSQSERSGGREEGKKEREEE